MDMTFRTSSKRRFAAAMLFVWIFALAAGIANACALGDAHGAHAPQLASQHHHDEAPEALDRHVHAGEPLGDAAPSTDTLDPACQKFCDDERSTLNLTLKDLGSAADMLPLLLLQPTTLVWTSGDELEADAPLAQAPACETGPPIPIRFLRLTI